MLLVKLPGLLEHQVRNSAFTYGNYVWYLMCNSFTERGAVKKGHPKAAKWPKPVKSPKGAKSQKQAAKSPKKRNHQEAIDQISAKEAKRRDGVWEGSEHREWQNKLTYTSLCGRFQWDEREKEHLSSQSCHAEADPSAVAESSSAVKSPSSCSTPVAASSIIDSSPLSAECSERELDSVSLILAATVTLRILLHHHQQQNLYNTPLHCMDHLQLHLILGCILQSSSLHTCCHSHSWPSSSEVGILYSTFIQLCSYSQESAI